MCGRRSYSSWTARTACAGGQPRRTQLGGRSRIEHHEKVPTPARRDLPSAASGGGHREHVARQLGRRDAHEQHARLPVAPTAPDFLRLEQLARQLTNRRGRKALATRCARSSPNSPARKTTDFTFTGGNQVRERAQELQSAFGDDLQGGQRLAHAQLMCLAQRVRPT